MIFYKLNVSPPSIPRPILPIESSSSHKDRLSSEERGFVTNLPVHTVLCLGNFDGVHIGHARLVSEALRKKQELVTKYPDISAGAWLFNPLPSKFLTESCRLLTQTPDKLEIFASLGLDFVILADFPELSALSPERFVTEILAKQSNAVALVCGFNYRFGRGASGDAEELVRLFPGDVSIIPPVLSNGTPVCSSKIRSLIENGEVANAAVLCGRPFFISGNVTNGAAVGRQLGFPTANQTLPPDSVCPRYGVYVSRVTSDGQAYPSVTDVGIRPTLYSSGSIVCETHLFGFDGNLYEKSIKTELLDFIRPEIKFGSREELKAAVENDIAKAAAYHGINPYNIL